jgi:hypothetical protein
MLSGELRNQMEMLFFNMSKELQNCVQPLSRHFKISKAQSIKYKNPLKLKPTR